MLVKPPHNEHELELAIVRRAGRSNRQALIDRTVLANGIVGQLLGEGAGVKGGSGLKFRYGSANCRYTMDFDTTRSIDLDAFIKGFRARLKAGWNGFTGEVDILEAHAPRGVPLDYVMQPLKVRLRYRNQTWCSVDLEITLGSAGSAEQLEIVPPNAETIALFTDLGLEVPGPVRLMSLEHQVAQKLRGVSGPGSRRAHDLIDLQLILAREDLNLARIGKICTDIFRGYGSVAWPPNIRKGENWDALYSEQLADLPVLATVDEAIAWANDIVAKIEHERQQAFGGKSNDN